jgi:predicted nuclease of predicted toxin-antitoxin system
VRDIGLATAEDEKIFSFAVRENYVLVSADTDFGTLHTLWRESRPSVIILKRTSQRRPNDQVALLLANLPGITEALEKGAIAVFEDQRIRIRSLPLDG